uniref:F-box domain-containing protein n=1 Tax=Tetranychus urticae TaxID=32264 RepID=T1JRU4_TETUR
MFINELPDDCLLIIFGLMDELDDLLNCYKVCIKWSHLIAERAKKVKYLVEHRDWWNNEPFPSYTFDHVYYRTEKPIDGDCLMKFQDLVTLVKNIKSFKGLIHQVHSDEESIFQYCDQLEMVSTDFMEPCIQKNGVNIKQLHISGYQLYYFQQDAHFFPNLERLHIYFNENWPDGYYDGPILRKLKILELFLSSYCPDDIYYGFQFMDSCPNLQSAHIYLQYNHIFVDESLKHKSLQDLVIEFFHPGHNESFNWNDWKRLFMKYTNLKHLAMCSFKDLENEHVEQMVRILPNLVLFEVRCCPGVTQKAADYVQDFNKLYGRSIKLYFDENHHEIQSDWPHLSTRCGKISQGFDFMKHCFLKHFHSLSIFLISDED